MPMNRLVSCILFGIVVGMVLAHWRKRALSTYPWMWIGWSFILHTDRLFTT